MGIGRARDAYEERREGVHGVASASKKRRQRSRDLYSVQLQCSLWFAGYLTLDQEPTAKAFGALVSLHLPSTQTF